MAKEVERGGPKASVKPKAPKPKASKLKVPKLKAPKPRASKRKALKPKAPEPKAPEPKAPESKAPDAFRTIREVAEELGLPQHVLRFWETKFGQVKPLKRGGGRRYYRPEDVGLLRRIRDLLYEEGYTIRGVQKLLKEGGAKHSGKGREGKARRPSEGGGPSETPSAPGLSPERRARLEAVMNELLTLRDMLRGRV